MSLSPLKLLAITAAVLLAGLVWQKSREIARADPRQHTGQNGIVMLGAEWCGYCQRLKAGLEAARVPYTELDVEDGGAGQDAFAALGGRGVPVTVIGQEVVHGYNTARLGELLADRGHAVQLK
ncbi:glutaredoxin domain-containing protein [Tahibacter sp.]|uniref:glutaredoxin family protein n=1 Tax=Tahibacter sp. TaxID=2056211 RepID=UPI0028C4EB45|nr:glutaredoxin domain-containing protein [Tahibacter sp.]